MKRSHVAWYVVAAIVVLGPASLRMWFWPQERPQKPDRPMAAAGKMLFTHEWTPNDPLSPNGDGLGPVFNATSCVACHKQGGVGGGGGVEHNVTTFISQLDFRGKAAQGVIHREAIRPEFQETLTHVHHELPGISKPSLASLLPESNLRHGVVVGKGNEGRINIPFGIHISQRNTPALFGARLIDQLPDRVIIAQERAQRVRWGMAPGDTTTAPVGRAFFLPDRRVGKFGWKAQSAALLDFVEAACANELGLGNPGQAQPQSHARKDYVPVGLDLTTEQCQQITAFISSLPQPQQRIPANPREGDRVHNGERLFRQVGCAECHTPQLGSIEGIYSDLLLHRMGSDLEGIGGGYNAPPTNPSSPGEGPLPDEWRTPPLWGVADSAPYLHDGRAATLEDAILLHGGQAQDSARQFQRLSQRDRDDVIAFLKSLRAPG